MAKLNFPRLNFPHIRAFTVTTTAKKVLEANPKRKAVLIYNNGSAPVELLSSPKAPYGQGIPIHSGSCYVSDHFNCQGEYWIICSSGTVEVRIEETIQQDA